RGALVSSAMPGGPAAAAGLQKYDVILSYDKTPVEDYDHFQRLTADTRGGSKVSLQVLRDMEKVEVLVTVGEGLGGGPGGAAAGGEGTVGDELLPGRRGRQLATLQRSRDQLHGGVDGQLLRVDHEVVEGRVLHVHLVEVAHPPGLIHVIAPGHVVHGARVGLL